MAWRAWKNEDIAATIIGFIRQRALGSPLVPYAERVERALGRVLAGRPWTGPQKTWLRRIGEQMKQEVVIDEAAFGSGAFASFGGFAGVDRALGGQLRSLLGDLQDAVWQDAG
ncbi:MAG: type I restriction-modification enzyme R subunit C-terminal domain-containing protein [Myxococcota bacterium]